LETSRWALGSNMSWLENLNKWCEDFDQKWGKEKGKGGFCHFAHEEFSKIDWSDGFDLDNFISEFFSLEKLPSQASVHSPFGNPPITIYKSKDNAFYLDLYIWEAISTSIHGHGFEGSFQVIKGISLNCIYDFVKARKIKEHCYQGELKTKELILMKHGESAKIHAGDQTVHRVLHLEPSSVSLVLRNYDSGVLQMDYYFKSIASPSFPSDDIVLKKRILGWQLKKDKKPDQQLLEELSWYYDFWQMLHLSPSFKKTLVQTAFQHEEKQVFSRLYDLHNFTALLGILEGVEPKILLTAYEYFEDERWIDWVEANTSITKEEAKDKLKGYIEKTDWYKNNRIEDVRFLAKLFKKEN